MQLDLELYREKVAVEPGVNLSVIDVSPRQPEQTLVLIHGFGGRASQWQYQFEAFATRYRVLSLDLRGHGQSTREVNDFRLDRLLADLDAVLEARGVEEPFILLGHSFGGAIVTEFAVRHPARLARLIMIASAGEYRLNNLYRLAFQLPRGVLRLAQPLFRGLVDASLTSLKQFFHQTLKPWRGWDSFPRLKVPTMVIMGDRDRVFPQAAFSRVAELVPDAEVVNVGVSAHMVMLERRDAVNRAIERFIAQSDGQHSQAQWRAGPGPGVPAGLLAERPWLIHYESGVPHTLDIPRVTLHRMLDRAWRRFPRRPALLFLGRQITYKTLSAHANRFAHALQALGVRQGDRILLLMPNVPQLVMAFYGTVRLGAIAVMGNPLATAEELTRQANQSGSTVLVTLTRLQDTARQIRAQSGIRHIIFANVKDYMPVGRSAAFTLRGERAGGHALIGPMAPEDHQWKTFLRGHPPQPPEVAVDRHAPAVIQYTSGTTAVPKGVTLSHHNLVANMVQTRAWLPRVRDGQEVVLCVIPFSHVYGMTTGMNVAVALGASMVLMPTYNVEAVLQAIKRYRPTFFPAVPPIYVAINDFPGVRRYNIESIQACICGAAPLPVEVKEAFEKLTRGRLVEGYGLSEASPVTHANPIYGRNKAGTIGLPLPNTEARIVDLRSRRPLPPGSIGELAVRGPQIMLGYWDNPEATDRMMDENGWLYTNDIARMDEEGYFQIISRRQDIWQGEDNRPIFPRDVEEVIYELPEVREAVVIAIANQPVAFVSVKNRHSIPAKTIIAFCQRRLPPSHVPRVVIFVKELPRSFIGKVLRRELVSQYAREIPVESGSVGDHLVGLEDD